MKSWVFILGRQPEIGFAELRVVIGMAKLQRPLTLVSSHVALLDSVDDAFDPTQLLARLGGTIKIAQVTNSFPRQRDTRANLKELLKNDGILREFDEGEQSKWTFGISVYGAEQDRDVARSVHDFGLDLKRYLKSRKRPARFVEPRGQSQALSSVVVVGNGLLTERGAEIVLVFGDELVWRAKTRTVQNFTNYSDRDYGRPERNPKGGSLPPKLAQIMLNLAAQPEGAYIVDPFCGIGTVLQEGLLMGYQMSGYDLDLEQVERSKKNLDWLRKHAPVPAPKVLAAADAATLKLTDKSIDALVTEGVLGPPRSRPLSPSEASQVAQDVARLWTKVLKHWKPALKPTARVVLTLPVLQTVGQAPTTVPLVDELPKLGYRLVALSSAKTVFANMQKARETLIYSRPDQVVGRELLVLSPVHGA